MNTITLTKEQLEDITSPVEDRYEALLGLEIASNDKRFLQQEKKYERKLEAANTRTAEWKQRYSETRKQLLEARTEIVELKRELRNR